MFKRGIDRHSISVLIDTLFRIYMREYEYRFKDVDSQQELDILQLNSSFRIEPIRPLASLIIVLNLLIDKSLNLAFLSNILQTVLSIYCFVYYYYIVCLAWSANQVYCVKDRVSVDSILKHYIEPLIWESSLKVNLNISNLAPFPWTLITIRLGVGFLLEFLFIF